MRVLYADRRAALLAALAAELDGDGAGVAGTRAGIDLTLRLPGVDDAALVAALARESVEAVALSSQSVAAPRAAGLVLGFAAFTPARLRRAAAVLGRLVRRM
jgi:GntR family transcriptional regulator/MocR family aminotransferase